LACKKLDRASWDTFAADFFEVRRVYIGTPSLANLTQIGVSEFARHVKSVIVYMNYLDDESVIPARQNNIDDQQQLLAGPNPEWERLMEIALALLPNLQTVEVRDFYGMRVRPDTGVYWRPYGISTRRQSDTRQSWDEENSGNGDFTEILLRGLFRILRSRADRGAPIAAFKMITRRWENAIKPRLIQPLLQPLVGTVFLTSLITLMLVLESQAPSATVDELDGGPRGTLRSFFGSLPNLKHLRVNGTGMFIQIETPYWCSCLHLLKGTALKRLEIGHVDWSLEELQWLTQTFKGRLEHVVLHGLFIFSRRLR
jgi:hypothetical protein